MADEWSQLEQQAGNCLNYVPVHEVFRRTPRFVPTGDDYCPHITTLLPSLLKLSSK